MKHPRLVTAYAVLNLLCFAYIFVGYGYSWGADSVFKFMDDGTRRGVEGCPPLTSPSMTYSFVTALYTVDNLKYLRYITLLAYTLQLNHPQIPRKLIYIEERPLPPEALCLLKAQGWDPYPVQGLPHPRGSYANHYRDQFNKLHLWNFTQYNSVLYLDADAYVLRPVDELFQLSRYFCLAAVPDNMYGDDVTTINAGVLLVRPNVTVFDELRTAYMRDQRKYDVSFAEQSFLNYYYQHEFVELPEIYNLNSALFASSPNEFSRLLAKAKIHHLTTPKPGTGSLRNPPPNAPRAEKHTWETLDEWFRLEGEMVESQWWKDTRDRIGRWCGGGWADEVVSFIEMGQKGELN